MAALWSVEKEGALTTFSSAVLAAGVDEVRLGGGLMATEEGEAEMKDDKDPSGSINGGRGGNCGCGGGGCCMAGSVEILLLLTSGGDSDGMMTGAGSEADPTVGDPI
jgi:hypothetical protein